MSSKAKINGKEFDLEVPSQCEAYWTLLAEEHLLGKQIMLLRLDVVMLQLWMVLYLS